MLMSGEEPAVGKQHKDEDFAKRYVDAALPSAVHHKDGSIH